MLTTVLLTLICYIIGSLMFSCWLGRIKGVDIRMYGDGNPGAINAFKAGGWLIGTLGLSLDYLKGFLPVLFVTRALRINDWRLVPIAVAPVLVMPFRHF